MNLYLYLYRTKYRYWATALLGLGLSSGLACQVLDVEQAVSLALERDSGLVALTARHEALNETAVADAALPDPELLIGAMGVPIEALLDADMMTQYQIGLRQRLPAAGTRALTGELGKNQADELIHQRAERRLEITRQTRLAWLDWTRAALRRANLVQAEAALGELERLTEARYGYGSGRLRDVEQARLEVLRLEQRQLSADSDLAASAARLERWTGQITRDRTPTDYPDWPTLPELDALIEGSLAHPLVAAALNRRNGSELELELAEAAYRPQWMIEGGYGHQRGRNPMTGQRQSDKFFAMVSMSLPLFTRQRQDRRVTAAHAYGRASEQELELRQVEIQGALETQHAIWLRQQRVIELINQRVLPQAQRTLESTYAAYGNNRASFDELIRTRLDTLERELELIDARHLLLSAATELRYWSAEDLP